MATVNVSEEEKKLVHEKVAKFREEIIASWRKPFQNPNPTNIKTVYCMTFYGEQVTQTAKCLHRVAPYVDRCVLVHDGTPKASDIDKLYAITGHKAEFIYSRWEDHFSKQRNVYLDHVEEGEWVIVSDPDELFDETFLKDMRAIFIDAEKEGINSILINSHDITTHQNGQTTKTVSPFFKQLMFKMEEGIRYIGRVHETLLPGLPGWRITNLDPRYYYEHHTTILEENERGARNIFIAGSSNDVRERNPLYVQWRKWAKQHNIQDWPQMRAYIRVGHIEDDLKQLFIDHRNDSGWEYEDESRKTFFWYKILFPEEMKGWTSNPGPPSKDSPQEVRAYVEQQYLNLLGRKADEKGAQLYVDSIIAGTVKRENLPTILMNSEEYQQKHTPTVKTKQKMPLKPFGDFIFYEQDWLQKLFKTLEFVGSVKYLTFKAALNIFLQNNGQIIVETGTQRLKDDPGGGSTSLLGAFCKKYGKKLFTVDNDPVHLTVSRECTKKFKNSITYVLMDSVEFLRGFDQKIDLLYLDSFDCPLPPEDATEAQIHNLNELKAALPKLHKGSIILIDDINLENGGKARLSKKYLLETGEWLCILDHGQTLWMRRS